MGLPIVVSDHCGSYGTTHDIQAGEYGVVFPMGDNKAVSEAVTALAMSPELLTLYSLRLRQHPEAVHAQAHGTFLVGTLAADGFLEKRALA